MKKLAILALLFLVGINVNAESVIKKTGCYGVYVTGVPFWTFWNRQRAFKLMAKKMNNTVEAVRASIDLKIPVLLTWDYKEAEQLKNELRWFNCDSEIREMKFVVQKEKGAESSDREITAQLNDVTAGVEKKLPKDSKPSLVEVRQAAIEVLEGAKDVRRSKMMEPVASCIQETNKTFFYKNDPIHPLIIKKFVSWESDDWKPKIVAVDVAAAYNTNQFYEKFKWRKSDDGTFQCSVDGKEGAWFVYRWLGTLDNGLHVVFTCDCGGGTGQFMNLFFFKITEGSAYTPEGEKYSQLLLTFVRNHGLGDRYDGQIDLLKNSVSIGKSRYNDKPIIIEFSEN